MKTSTKLSEIKNKIATLYEQVPLQKVTKRLICVNVLFILLLSVLFFTPLFSGYEPLGMLFDYILGKKFLEFYFAYQVGSDGFIVVLFSIPLFVFSIFAFVFAVKERWLARTLVVSFLVLFLPMTLFYLNSYLFSLSLLWSFLLSSIQLAIIILLCRKLGMNEKKKKRKTRS